MTVDLDAYLKVAVEAAKKGSKVLLKYWGKLKSIQHKTFSWDLVTEADKESEREIISFIQHHFPHHSILAEESGKQEASDQDNVWCIDPLDGTTNYTHQFPLFCVSIALLLKGRPIVGVVYNPIYEELFCAAQGQGATLNGKPISVSNVQTLEKSLLVTGFSYDRKATAENNYKEFCYLTHLSQGVRRCGSAALDLANVAAGRLDGYWERGLQPWDISAGVVLVQEAGGVVTQYDNSSVNIHAGRILATNGHIHEELSKAVQHAPQFFT